MNKIVQDLVYNDSIRSPLKNSFSFFIRIAELFSVWAETISKIPLPSITLNFCHTVTPWV